MAPELLQRETEGHAAPPAADGKLSGRADSFSDDPGAAAAPVGSLPPIPCSICKLDIVGGLVFSMAHPDISKLNICSNCMGRMSAWNLQGLGLTECENIMARVLDSIRKRSDLQKKEK